MIISDADNKQRTVCAAMGETSEADVARAPTAALIFNEVEEQASGAPYVWGGNTIHMAADSAGDKTISRVGSARDNGSALMDIRSALRYRDVEFSNVGIEVSGDANPLARCRLRPDSSAFPMPEGWQGDLRI